MKIQKIKNWVVPEGAHQASVTDVRIVRESNSGKSEEVLKVIFRIKSLRHPVEDFFARTIYSATDMARFSRHFSLLLGKPIFDSLFTLQGELIPEGLKFLKNLNVDLLVVHRYNAMYEQPLCVVADVAPPCELVECFDQEASMDRAGSYAPRGLRSRAE